MLVETAVLICLTLLLLYGYIRQQWNIFNERNIPHDRPTLRNLGHATLMLGTNAVKYELQCKRKYGRVWGYYIFMRPRITVHDPEIVQHIMVKNFSSFQNRFNNPADFGMKAIEHGLLVALGKRWKRMRNTLSPTFSNMKLKGMSAIINGCIKNTLIRIEKWGDKRMTSVDIKDLFNRLSMDAICSTVFSVDVNSQDELKAVPEISKYAKQVFEYSFSERIRLFLKLSFPFLMKYLGEGTRTHTMSYFRNICQMMVNARTSTKEPKETAHAQRRPDIMDAMINARKTVDEITNEQKGLSDSEILGNAITMLLAGYETTAIAMTYLAYNLAVHANVQERLQTEIDEAFPEGVDVDFDAASNLQYLNMCINESLRLYCPVARTMRSASCDVEIGCLKIPKDTEIAIPVAALCRDPEFWEDPMLYNPERMRDMRNINPAIYQPFGNGPRNCIGLKFALMEIKLAMCAILRKYTFKATAKTPKPPLILKQFTTTSPIDDISLQLLPR